MKHSDSTYEKLAESRDLIASMLNLHRSAGRNIFSLCVTCRDDNLSYQCSNASLPDISGMCLSFTKSLIFGAFIGLDKVVQLSFMLSE